MPANDLLIRLIKYEDSNDEHTAQFQVELDGVQDQQPAAVVEVPNPYEVILPGERHLMQELQWYLEEFIFFPYAGNETRANRLRAAVRKWGEDVFIALLDSGAGSKLYNYFCNDPGTIRIVCDSDHAHVLGWPWEALYDPDKKRYLSHLHHVDRRLTASILQPKQRDLPRETLNILLVTARPYEQDVRFRTIARPLLELTKQQPFPISVHILRPPSFTQLTAHLNQHPNHYHVLHFDGHGRYRPGSTGGGSQMFEGEGQLVFETETGEPDPITAKTLSDLLIQHNVPVAVLNACQSAMTGENNSDPFASVAAALLQGGVGNVTAMAYSLLVAGANVFLPAFYGELFHSGDIHRAVSAGRREMSLHPERISPRGPYPLEDWLLPVHYRRETYSLDFFSQADKATAPTMRPQRVLLHDDDEHFRVPYGFVGRDSEFLTLERAYRSKTPAILVSGLGGTGKSTLAREFIHWLADTGGLGIQQIAQRDENNPDAPPLVVAEQVVAFWFNFQGIGGEKTTSSFFFSKLALILGANGDQILRQPLDQQVLLLAQVFRQIPTLIVWDNFEVVRGMPGTAVEARFKEEDQRRMHRFLEMLGPDSKCKVLITSRGRERWIQEDLIRRTSLTGLDGEERWQYVNEIAQAKGLKVDRTDETFKKLIDRLEGHPLAMRVLLPRLDKETPQTLLQRMDSELADVLDEEEETDDGDSTRAKTQRGLRYTFNEGLNALSDDVKPLLIPLALHERYVDVRLIPMMAEGVEGWDEQKAARLMKQLMSELSDTGLVVRVEDLVEGDFLYNLHPAFNGYLRSTVLRRTHELERIEWEKQFTLVLAKIAELYAPKALHEKRIVHAILEGNFRRALALTEMHELDGVFAALLQALAEHARQTRDFDNADVLFAKLAAACKTLDDKKGLAGALHQRGIIAFELGILGRAEQYFQKALDIQLMLGEEAKAAMAYHQLGIVAEVRHEYNTAEKLLRQALQFAHVLPDEGANVYHELGIMALEQLDYDAAEDWYKKSLKIKLKLGNEHEAASNYHELGRVAEGRRDYSAAEDWYKKSLEIMLKLGNETGASMDYHHLGTIAKQQGDFETAEGWYKKSLEIKLRLGDKDGVARTYAVWGMLQAECQDHHAAADSFLQSLALFLSFNQPENLKSQIASASALFFRSWRELPETEQQQLRQKYEQVLGQAWPSDKFIEKLLQSISDDSEQGD